MPFAPVAQFVCAGIFYLALVWGASLENGALFNAVWMLFVSASMAVWFSAGSAWIARWQRRAGDVARHANNRRDGGAYAMDVSDVSAPLDAINGGLPTAANESPWLPSPAIAQHTAPKADVKGTSELAADAFVEAEAALARELARLRDISQDLAAQFQCLRDEQASLDDFTQDDVEGRRP